MKKAILVVSFGTSHEDTRKLTIDAIEKELGNEFPEYAIYRAWTSKMILAKLKKRDQVHYDNVKEAMERMALDGITEVIVQPTHVMNGVENDLMKEDVQAYQNRFHKIVFGTPLLTTEEDNKRLAEVIAEGFSDVKEEEALVLMGHGTEHYANAVYAALDYRFKDMGYKNVIVGTVEGYPGLEQVMKQLKERSPKKVVIAPLMIVAGDHARNDMAGAGEDSWKSQMEAEGYEVQAVLRGLGEYENIRRMFADHVRSVL